MRSRKKSVLRVFKLRSGEEIVATYAGKSKDKIKLQRPMRVVNAVQADPFTGARRQVTYFTDWLGCTNSLNAEIPQDFVLVDFDPSPEICSLYSRQIEMEDKIDTPQLPLHDEQKSVDPPLPKTPAKNPYALTEEERQEIEDEIDKMMKEYKEKGGGDTLPANPLIPNGNIVFSLGIPRNIMEEWINSGFMDYLQEAVQDFITGEFIDDVLEEMEEERKPRRAPQTPSRRERISKNEWKEPNDDQKKDPKFGNKAGDWSPFAKDYLDPGEEKKTDGLDSKE